MTTFGDILRRLAGAHRAFGRRRPAGFTLVEVLVAVSLLAAITAMTWVGVSNMFEMRDLMTDRFERYQIMRVAMDRMSREFASAYLAGPSLGGEQLPGERDDSRDGSSTNASSTADSRAKMQALREPIQFGMIGRDDQVSFTSFGHIRSVAGEKSSQHAEIEYFTERRRDEDTGRFVTSLMRREDTTMDDDITDGGTVYTMIPSIESVEFEYWDTGPVEIGTMEEVAEGDWKDTWDTTKSEFGGRLPTRVRVTVTLPARNERDSNKTFSIQTQIDTTEVLEF